MRKSLIDEIDLQILLHINDLTSMSLRGFTRKYIGKDPSTVLYHLRKLQQLGIIKKVQQGYAIDFERLISEFNKDNIIEKRHI